MEQYTQYEQKELDYIQVLAKKKFEDNALIGFILGLASIFIFPLIGIVAVIFSHKALRMYDPQLSDKKWMAIVGLVLGYTAIGLAVLLIIFVIIMVVVMIAASSSNTYY